MSVRQPPDKRKRIILSWDFIVKNTDQLLFRFAMKIELDGKSLFIQSAR